MTISIVTCWRNHPELIEGYEAAVQGAQVVIVNNSWPMEAGFPVAEMTDRIRAQGLIFGGPGLPFSFAAACNKGLEHATGDIVMMLNNDITANAGWLAQVERDVRPGGLYGPETHLKMIGGRPLLYVDGWCVAARREVWDALGGFDAETFTRPYWEDVDLSWRAVQMGYTLHRCPWPVRHLNGGNTTARTTPGAYDASAANGEAFERKVAASMAAVLA